MSEQNDRYAGVAYGRRPGAHNPKLTDVGPGTPCGEYMRRFWHPVAVVSDVTTRPKKVRLLGEELILFKDGTGKLGLLYPRCAHRGSSLFYGKVDERGIRCCYHGWLFDTEGNCLEQPCEKDGGRRRNLVRQPWYPVQERYGLVFAYLGPAEKMPVLPRYDVLEDLPPGYTIDNHNFGPGLFAYGDVNAVPGDESIPYNWFQLFENDMDHFHVWYIAASISSTKPIKPSRNSLMSGPTRVSSATRSRRKRE